MTGDVFLAKKSAAESLDILRFDAAILLKQSARVA